MITLYLRGYPSSRSKRLTRVSKGLSYLFVGSVIPASLDICITQWNFTFYGSRYLQASVLVKMHYSGSESDNESAVNPNNEMQFISEEVAAALSFWKNHKYPTLNVRRMKQLIILLKNTEIRLESR